MTEALIFQQVASDQLTVIEYSCRVAPTVFKLSLKEPSTVFASIA